MSRTLRALSALLEYPDAALREHLAELRSALREESALSAACRGEVESLIDFLERSDPLEVEAGYVGLFDRGRATSLHLFEHVHGDSRDRGPAMIDLGATYAKAGLVLLPGELPDYLPAVLEFVSTQPPREARAFLGEIAHILDALAAGTAQRRSAYANVFRALLALAGEKPKALAPSAEEPLDETWAEPPPFDGCSTRGQARPGSAQPVRIVRKTDSQRGVRS